MVRGAEGCCLGSLGEGHLLGVLRQPFHWPDRKTVPCHLLCQIHSQKECLWAPPVG